jgi:hypothetical protein
MSLLLSNDRTVRGEASSRGIDAMNLPQMLRGLWRTGVMKKEDVAKLAEEIERKDNVVFKDRRLIVHKAPHARGRRRDLTIYRGNHPSLPKEVEQDFDRGYDGVRNYFPGLKCALSFKKRAKGRGHMGEKAEDLTPEQKSFNKELSKARVVVERTISRVK